MVKSGKIRKRGKIKKVVKLKGPKSKVVLCSWGNFLNCHLEIVNVLTKDKRKERKGWHFHQIQNSKPGE